MDGEDHSAAATQNTLSESFIGTSTSVTEDDQNQFLHFSYNYGPRSLKDLTFLLLFCLFVLCTFGFGIFACVHHNPHSFEASSFLYNAISSSCNYDETLRTYLVHDKSPSSLNASNLDITSFNAHPTSLNSVKSNLFVVFVDFRSFIGNPSSLNSRSWSLWESLIWTLVLTLILSGPLVLFLLFLLKHYTVGVLVAFIPFFVMVSIYINVYWFVACNASSSCIDAFPLGYRIFLLFLVFFIIGVLVWIFIVNVDRMEMTVWIIHVASTVLSRNLQLFGVLPALILGLFVYYVPIILFLIFADRNGKIMPREEKGEYFCVWKQDSWVPAYYTLAILTMLWSAAAMVEAQAYVVSGTIAQWYFSKSDLLPRRGIRSTLR